jgi:hypothetical protein
MCPFPFFFDASVGGFFLVYAVWVGGGFLVRLVVCAFYVVVFFMQ